MTNTNLMKQIVEAIDNVDWYRKDSNNDMVLGAANEHEAWYKAEDIYRALENVLSAQSEQQWIPVSERMPEPRVDVWCNSDMGQMVGYYDEYVGTWYGRDCLELIVTAWMPLPEPYKEDQINL